ncbi:hypothetical protein GCM10025864_21940 [Luteimicrobium album]|uniref:Uncharacterized protein n=1 Tax=Luteimicrobium album TaxID=1054550 RepID=A0ABQ6I3S5_9MICO|nr:hypothetical protein GCM10025864_21940 [Luteimicrobium album]
MERLGVRRVDGRDETDPGGPRGEPRTHERRVEAALQRGPALRPQREGVIEEHEVEQPVLGGRDEAGEPGGVERARGDGSVRTPGAGVGTAVGEVDAEVKGAGRGHGGSSGVGEFRARSSDPAPSREWGGVVRCPGAGPGLRRRGA